MAERQSKRTWIVEEGVVQTPDGELVLGQEFDMDRARVLLDRLLGTLAEIGGVVSVVADRVKVGEGPGGTPLAVTQRLVVEWQAFSPLRDAPSSEGAESEPLPWDPAPEELEEELEAREHEAAVAVGGDAWDTDAEPIEEPDE